MAAVAGAGRTIAWVYEQSWGGHVRNQVKRHPRSRSLPASSSPTDRWNCWGRRARPTTRRWCWRWRSPPLVTKLRSGAARSTGCAPSSCHGPTATARAGRGALDELVALLLEGHRAIPVLETLDQAGLLSRILPEWQAVRSKPQRAPTASPSTVTCGRRPPTQHSSPVASVDPTCCSSARCSTISARATRDHTDAGVELFDAIGVRLGLNASDVDVVVHLVRNHLLLPSVAVNRDLADPATIAAVAEQVRSVDELELLHALTVADSLATGPTAWSSWKEDLVKGSSIAPENGSTVPRPLLRRGSCSPMPTRWRRWPPTASRC